VIENGSSVENSDDVIPGASSPDKRSKPVYRSFSSPRAFMNVGYRQLDPQNHAWIRSQLAVTRYLFAL